METNKRINYKSYWKHHIGKLITITTEGGFNHTGIVGRERKVMYLWGKIDYWQLNKYGIQKVKSHSLEELIIWKLINE